jgi:hypothetical protein
MSLHEQFEQMYAEYFEGVSHGRREYLDRVLADEFFSTDPAGVRRFKDDYIAFCLEHISEDLQVELSDIHIVELDDDTVVFSSAARMGPHPLGDPADPYIHIRYLGVWGRRDGEWRYLVQQGTPAPRG